MGLGALHRLSLSSNCLLDPVIRSVLIANRGEIACRIIRACRLLGIQSIAVYSEADADALHRQMADRAVAIGPAPAIQSYLDSAKVLEAARSQGADAVHPGYGFLSENAGFASAVQEAGLAWIGPDPASMTAMGDKARARQIAVASGVPVLPGSDRLPADDPQAWHAAAQTVGYPLLVKAVGGGGGIGMKRVDDAAALQATVESAQAMAAKAFKHAEVYLERFVSRARHIEIQIFGYGDGRAVHLFERDCSAQRRFQKIVEESPAPHLPADVRDRMAQAALALARHQRYSGAGTVEFIMDAVTHEFFFLEMNTRIQVEHAVTEAVTGWDLVQQQILLAGGMAEPVAQADIRSAGTAIECRVYAENPAKQFLPSPGRLDRFRLPAESPGLRVDCGVRENDVVTPYYDPMIAKLIAHGPTRHDALQTMQRALAQVEIAGIRHNVPFLQSLLAHPDFLRGDVDTGFVDRNRAELLAHMAALA
ncbi:MAG: acetyl-CoA carboxylase biotin carboxylase subunit [Rhizobacter sp.]|nr:acetyl-CoA carboxylase biotin carboxylase subunit [Rhizobacter sp.]